MKPKGAEAERMLYELLYNAPPLYHLDRDAWTKQKASITGFLKVWSPFHSKAVKQELTTFSILSDDQMVQSAQYGDKLKVIVNFSGRDVTLQDGQSVKAKSAVIIEEKRTLFDAEANAKLLATS